MREGQPLEGGTPPIALEAAAGGSRRAGQAAGGVCSGQAQKVCYSQVTQGMMMVFSANISWHAATVPCSERQQAGAYEARQRHAAHDCMPGCPPAMLLAPLCGRQVSPVLLGTFFAHGSSPAAVPGAQNQLLAALAAAVPPLAAVAVSASRRRLARKVNVQSKYLNLLI